MWTTIFMPICPPSQQGWITLSASSPTPPTHAACWVPPRWRPCLPPRSLVNVGRGGALDDSALAAALSSGRLAGAVLDVFRQEPLPPDHFFWDTPNLFITSHTAAPSFPEDIAKVFIENYNLSIKNEPLKYQVNFKKGY